MAGLAQYAPLIGSLAIAIAAKVYVSWVRARAFKQQEYVATEYDGDTAWTREVSIVLSQKPKRFHGYIRVPARGERSKKSTTSG